MLFGIGLDKKKNLSILAVDWDDGDGEYMPLGTPNDCIDHYKNAEKGGGSRQSQVYTKKKGDKYLAIEFDADGRLKDVRYETKDKDGNRVKFYMSRENELPHTRPYENLSEYKNLSWLLEDEEAKDCDHVSQSGEEEGSGAP